MADFLVIAEATLGYPSEVLMESAHIVQLAESGLAAPAAAYGGVEFYPEAHRKAAILYCRLARNHPLPDGNKRVAFMCMNEFLERNGYCLDLRASDTSDHLSKLLALVASSASLENSFVEWVGQRVRRRTEQEVASDDTEPASS